MANSLLNAGRSKEALALLKTRGRQSRRKTAAWTRSRDEHHRLGRPRPADRDDGPGGAGLAEGEQPGRFQRCRCDKAVKWIGQQRGGYGGFGSTQSTILALKALIAHARANKKTPEGGELMLYVNGKLAGIQEFKAGAAGPIGIDLKPAEDWLKPGTNEIRLKIIGQERSFPFTAAWSYHTVTPLSADKCAVRLTTSLSQTQVKEGDSVRLTAVIENAGGPGKGQRMTVAVIGLPVGPEGAGGHEAAEGVWPN